MRRAVARRSRAETIERFRADMARLLDTVSSLPTAQRAGAVYGRWTVKEILAHIAAWDRELRRGIDELLSGQMPALVRYASRVGEPQFNARAVDASREAPFADVLAELEGAHQGLVSRIEALSDDEWEGLSPYRWGYRTPMTFGSLFDYTYKDATHYGGHAKEIEPWAARQG